MSLHDQILRCGLLAADFGCLALAYGVLLLCVDTLTPLWTSPARKRQEEHAARKGEAMDLKALSLPTTILGAVKAALQFIATLPPDQARQTLDHYCDAAIIVAKEFSLTGVVTLFTWIKSEVDAKGVIEGIDFVLGAIAAFLP